MHNGSSLVVSINIIEKSNSLGAKSFRDQPGRGFAGFNSWHHGGELAGILTG